MRDLNYYQEKKKKEIIEKIKSDIKKGPVKFTIEITINSTEDLDKKMVKSAIKRESIREANKQFNKDKVASMWFVTPTKGAILNGIELDEGIVLPVIAPKIYEPHEITDKMMTYGLTFSLAQEYDEYYLKILKSFDLSKIEDVSPISLEMVGGTYWNDKNEKI